LRFVGLSLALCVPGCAAVLAIPLEAEAGRLTLSFLHYPALLERYGHLKVRAEGTPDVIYVLALDNGEFAAVSPICTHQGCTVDIAGAHLVCPCHGSTYDREGNVVRGPAPQSLRRYAVTRTEEAVVVDLGAGR
jgi:Rieske Fe-S protein